MTEAVHPPEHQRVLDLIALREAIDGAGGRPIVIATSVAVRLSGQEAETAAEVAESLAGVLGTETGATTLSGTRDGVLMSNFMARKLLARLREGAAL